MTEDQAADILEQLVRIAGALEDLGAAKVVEISSNKHLSAARASLEADAFLAAISRVLIKL